VDEADSIPNGGQVRLLSALEQSSFGIWIFTSNEEVESWEPRFLSRFTVLQFSNQRLAEPAARWLRNIAIKEGLNLAPDEAEKIIRASKNNLRAALQRMEALLGDRQTPMMHDLGEIVQGSLPIITAPMTKKTPAPVN
jgi:DNA polymerase III delta prime subunit